MLFTPFNLQSGTTLERTLSTPSNAPNPLELKLGKPNSAMLQALVGAAHGLPSRLVCFERLVMMKIWRVVFILRAIRWNWTIATGNDETAYWEMTRIWCFREWLIYTDHFWKLQVYFMALCCFNQGDLDILFLGCSLFISLVTCSWIICFQHIKLLFFLTTEEKFICMSQEGEVKSRTISTLPKFYWNPFF